MDTHQQRLTLRDMWLIMVCLAAVMFAPNTLWTSIDHELEE